MLNSYDESGNLLDAGFLVEGTSSRFAITIASHGGKKGFPSERNGDYSRALRLHLQRLAELGFSLRSIRVDSRPARKLPEAAREIWPKNFAKPLLLSDVDDFEELRLAIGRSAAAHARQGDSSGNMRKQLRLEAEAPLGKSTTRSELEALLIAHNSIATWTEQPTADQAALHERARRARQRAESPGRGESIPRPPGELKPDLEETKTSRFIRDPNVVAWVMANTQGVCEACGTDAPFVRSDGEPYLEVHHVRPLAEGGPDTTDNAIACCPNCHRALHHSSQRGKLRQSVIKRVDRLVDWPEKPKP